MEEKPVYLERTRQKLELAKNIHNHIEVTICNRNFIIYPNVFNPNIFFGTEFLAKELVQIISEFDENTSINMLEIGTGAGYISILSILHGVSHVTSTDINPDGLRNAEENARKHNIQDRMTIKFSDVYNELDSNEKFHIIFWNHPFGHVNKSIEDLELLERAVLDPFYTLLDRYLKNAHDYLVSNNGRLFLGFSNTAGYQENFEILATKYNWKVNLRNEIKSNTVPIMQMGMYELIKI